MKIDTLVTGAFSTNTYVISTDKGKIVIDPSGKAQKIIDALDSDILCILLTHGHFDHIKAVDGLYATYHCQIMIHPRDRELVDPCTSKMTNAMGPFTACIKSPICEIQKDVLHIEGVDVKVYHTPGHTKGSCLFMIGGVLFSGDTLFKEGVGRTDLYGGNERLLHDSLRIFKDFDQDVIVYPGHGDSTTIGHELSFNPFLRCI